MHGDTRCSRLWGSPVRTISMRPTCMMGPIPDPPARPMGPGCERRVLAMGQGSDRRVRPIRQGRQPPQDMWAVTNRSDNERVWWKTTGIDPLKVVRRLWEQTRLDDGQRRPQADPRARNLASRLIGAESDPGYFSPVETLVKVVLRVEPMFVTAATIMIEIAEAIRAYSIAVVPRSSERSRASSVPMVCPISDRPCTQIYAQVLRFV